MALASINLTATDDAGNILSGASVEVRREIVGQPLATLYTDRDGTIQGSNPAVTDDNGHSMVFVSGGAYQITITKGAYQRIMRYVAVGTAAEHDVGQVAPGLFEKADWQSVGFFKTGVGTISIKVGTKVELAGTVHGFVADTAVQMPTLNAGTDYAIYMCNDGTVRADASFTAPAGFDTTTSRKIGGFHFSPGGNAPGQAGGDSTPTINEYSLWDLKFRPSASDPRGMTLVAGLFWCDIYLLNVDHLINGTSRYGATIADQDAPPKIPTAFGGDGSATYGALTWWEAAEVMAAHGKRLLDYAEFAAAAYGVTESTSVGADPVTCALDAPRTSKWGLMQATGNMRVWGGEKSIFTAVDWTWFDLTGGRGQLFISGMSVSVFGGSFNDTIYSGSRSSTWQTGPWFPETNKGARGRCDHVCHV